jgi:hypothetical protein
MAKIVVRAIAPIIVLGAVAGAAVFIAKNPFVSNSSHVEAVKSLAVAHPQQQLAGPGVRSLRLQAFSPT